MTASVPKRVGPFENPLTARAGPYMYLPNADKGSVSNVDITTPMPLIYKTLFSSISTFETPPNHSGSLQPIRTGGGSISLRPFAGKCTWKMAWIDLLRMRSGFVPSPLLDSADSRCSAARPNPCGPHNYR